MLPLPALMHVSQRVKAMLSDEVHLRQLPSTTDLERAALLAQSVPAHVRSCTELGLVAVACAFIDIGVTSERDVGPSMIGVLSHATTLLAAVVVGCPDQRLDVLGMVRMWLRRGSVVVAALPSPRTRARAVHGASGSHGRVLASLAVEVLRQASDTVASGRACEHREACVTALCDVLVDVLADAELPAVWWSWSQSESVVGGLCAVLSALLTARPETADRVAEWLHASLQRSVTADSVLATTVRCVCVAVCVLGERFANIPAEPSIVLTRLSLYECWATWCPVALLRWTNGKDWHAAYLVITVSMPPRHYNCRPRYASMRCAATYCVRLWLTARVARFTTRA